MKKSKNVSPVVATVVILVVVLLVALVWMKFAGPSNTGGQGNGMFNNLKIDTSKVTPDVQQNILKNIQNARSKTKK